MTTSRLLISLDDARNHLRFDPTDDDAEIDQQEQDVQPYAEAASELVINYLKSAANAFLNRDGTVKRGSDGSPDVPHAVRGATRLMLGYLYKDRDNDAGKEYEHGMLPKPVTALLYPLRDPSVA
jgi:hypothetical protein